MRMSVEQWWHDTDRRKQKYSKQTEVLKENRSTERKT
jgi:hypothetical protein